MQGDVLMANKFKARGSYWCLTCNADPTICHPGEDRKAWRDHDTVWFDSKKEAARYHELRLLEMAGEISALTVKPVYLFEVQGVVVGKWKLDFCYLEKGAIKETVEDVKGFMNSPQKQVFDLKCNLMKAIYGLEVKTT